MGNEADIQAVLDRRHDNGADFWATVDGRLGVGRPFSTIESIVILHELGLGAGHEAVGGALDLLLGAWRDDGRFHVDRPALSTRATRPTSPGRCAASASPAMTG